MSEKKKKKNTADVLKAQADAMQTQVTDSVRELSAKTTVNAHMLDLKKRIEDLGMPGVKVELVSEETVSEKGLHLEKDKPTKPVISQQRDDCR